MNFRNPSFVKNGWIDCEIEHPVYGWIPFACDPNDKGADFDTKELFDRMKDKASAYVPPAPPGKNILAAEARANRNSLLLSTDWTQLPDVPDETKKMWAEYRTALRDITNQPNFPTKVEWPNKPDTNK